MKTLVILLMDMDENSIIPKLVTGLFGCLILIVLGYLIAKSKHNKEKEESELNPIEFSVDDVETHFFIVKFKDNKVLLKNDTMKNSHAKHKERWYKKDNIPIELQKERTWIKVTYVDDKIQFSKDDMHHHF